MFLTEFISQNYIYIIIGLATFFILLVFVFLFYAISYKRSIKEAENEKCQINEDKIEENKKQENLEKEKKETVKK